MYTRYIFKFYSLLKKQFYQILHVITIMSSHDYSDEAVPHLWNWFDWHNINIKKNINVFKIEYR